METLSPTVKGVSLAFQLIAAFILGYAALMKFSGAQESVYVFQTLGIEGTRLVIAVIEGVAAVLLLTKMPHYGAILGFGTMLGALLAHTFTLGMEVQGDGGLLVSLMLLVILSTLVVMWIHRKKLPLIGHTF